MACRSWSASKNHQTDMGVDQNPVLLMILESLFKGGNLPQQVPSGFSPTATHPTKMTPKHHGGNGDVHGRCFDAHFWRAPACRHDGSTCVPYITGGTGWGSDEPLQKVSWRKRWKRVKVVIFLVCYMWNMFFFFFKVWFIMLSDSMSDKKRGRHQIFRHWTNRIVSTQCFLTVC